ncbi:LysR family transcriptional regulator [Spartinivicinus poritis]|uniref:LysR family transcriptional regulator n=1 Tax=Spartinivicinus poritis TaxID=2994640 RepID=A0ABT5UC35_9GAMM|nr:LysR family transcriptional regulator [Spartinivicinus sp. A2-2]MDE1462988.1 LysR family transcriptional regulator [Spartinivicinus sp. A2-2]
MSVTLRQLRLFEATARLGRLTAAADEQAMSQSAASQSLKELELSLGYPLFSRVGRELVITDAGLDVLAKARQVTDMVNELQTAPTSEMTGVLRVVASETIASFLMPKLLAEFIDAHKQVKPELKIANTQDVIEKLDKGQAHIGLIEGPAIHQYLTIKPWRQDQLNVFCHPEHPLAKKGKLTLEDIQQQQWILREPGSGTRAVFDAAIERIGGRAILGLELTRHEAIKQSVKAGLGLGCLSQLAIADEVMAGQLVVLKTPLDLTRRFSLLSNENSYLNAPAQGFVKFLLESS